MEENSLFLTEGLSSVSLEAHAKRSFWTPGPAWVAVAGAMACGIGVFHGEAILQLLALAFLVDPAWGGLWYMAQRWPGAADPKPHPAVGPRIPYLRTGSPAHVVGGWLDSLGVPAARTSGLLQAFSISLLLGLILSIGLGRAAVAATLATAAGVVVARFSRGSKWLRGVILSTLQFALPWALVAEMYHGGEEVWILGGLWAATHILMVGAGANAWDRKWTLAGQIALMAWFAWVRHPAAVAPLAMAFLPIWLSESVGDEWLAASGPWWLAALIVSSLALRA